MHHFVTRIAFIREGLEGLQDDASKRKNLKTAPGLNGYLPCGKWQHTL